MTVALLDPMGHRRALEIIRNRVDELGVVEPSIQKQGMQWVVVQLPGVKDPQRAIELIGQTALLEFKLVSERAASEFVDDEGSFDEEKLPADLELAPHRDGRTKIILEAEQLMTGALLATASADDTAKLWDAAIHRPTVTLSGHNGDVQSVAFSPDGKTLATASGDTTVRLWNTDGELLTTLEGHVATVWRVAFSPDGERLASAGLDQAVILWNLERGEIERDDRVIVISTAHGLKFTDFKVGYHDQTLEGIASRHANPPLELPASYDAVSEAIDKTFGK